MFALRKPDSFTNQSSQKNDILKNFEEVERSQWLNNEPRTFIKYEKTDGKIVAGGYLINKAYEDGIFRLKKDINEAISPEWEVSLNSIRTIWKRRRSYENNESITRIIKDLADRISILENTPPIESRDYSSEIAQCQVDIANIKSDLEKVYECLQQIIARLNE